MVWWSGFSRKRRVDPTWYRDQGRVGTRVRLGGLIAVRVRGRSGTYEVFGSPLALDCTCGAEHRSCPHVKAIAADFEANESRFIDLRQVMAALSDADNSDELVERTLLSNPGRILDIVEQRRNVERDLRPALAPIRHWRPES